MTAKTYAEAARTHDHLAMLMSPDWWPLGALPVKRHRDGKLELGTVLPHDTKVVLHANIFNAMAGGDEMATVRRDRYETHLALLNDGWEVD